MTKRNIPIESDSLAVEIDLATKERKDRQNAQIAAMTLRALHEEGKRNNPTPQEALQDLTAVHPTAKKITDSNTKSDNVVVIGPGDTIDETFKDLSDNSTS